MRRLVLMALLGAACLAALFSFNTSAQVVDPTPCEQTCDEQHTLCITDCGTSTDPIECEGGCEDRHQDCLRRCS